MMAGVMAGAWARTGCAVGVGLGGPWKRLSIENDFKYRLDLLMPAISSPRLARAAVSCESASSRADIFIERTFGTLDGDGSRWWDRDESGQC